MEKEKITITGDGVNESHEIETKPITCIFTSPNMVTRKISYPNRIEISAMVTMHHAQKVNVLHAEFEEYWRYFMSKVSEVHRKKIDYEISSTNIRKMGDGCIHLMGLIDLSLKFQDLKIPFMWKYPESYLHPGWQVSLADLAIKLQQRAGAINDKEKPNNST